MDFHSSGGKSVSEDLNYTIGLNLSSVSQNTSFGDGLASELSDTLNESLHIEDAQESSEVDDYGDVNVIKSDQKCLMKYETIPCSDKMPPSDDAYSEEEEEEEEEEEDEEPLEEINNHLLDMNPIVTRSICLPVDGDLMRTIKFVDALRIPYIAPSFGGCESIVDQPAIMSYWETSWSAQR